ncbi:FxsA family protein [uncultured Thiodictyon sp.]|uniref:FxsA family protein n=1 Tax=uncultured Thiodictyon sp. TaxID=1846217 RepID=UPI0025FD6088|nr:FxsA family protein [uncultured Thiodictyon sp.]
MPILILFFIGLPIIEIYFLIEVGAIIGAVPAIALTLLCALLGTWLVRRQGFSVLMRVRESLARDEVPALELVDGALLLVAGLFLLLPGFLTDIVGFLLLIPPLRRLVIRRTLGVIPVRTFDADPGRGPRVIEGHFRRED